MFNSVRTALFALIAGMAAPAFAEVVNAPAMVVRESQPQSEIAPQERLAKADSYRFSGAPIKTITHVHEYKHDKLQKTQIYEVFSKPGKGSLAVFKSAAQAGQKVLMQDDKFWIFMPNSRQPLRISPLQKLLGDASVGDLATLSWSENYRAILAEESLEAKESINEREILLDLEAQAKGVSYYRILLVLDRGDNFPLRAKFFMKSGKLAKVATFNRGEVNQQPWVTEMTFENDVVKNEKTVMQVISAENREIPDKIFNPSFLVRSNIEDV